MSQQITNRLRATSVIRVTGAETLTVNLEDLSSNTSIETITSASIKRAIWSTNTSITVTRDTETVLELYGGGDMRLSEMKYVIDTNANTPLNISVGSGSLFLEITKDAQYNPNLEEIY